MSSTDLDFFKRQLAAVKPLAAQDKYAQVVAASNRISASLGRMAAESEAAKARMDEANKNSWVNQAGFELNSFSGQALDTAAHFYSGTSRLAGQLVGLAAGGIPAAIADAALTGDQRAAVGRYRQGKASQADMDLITARRGEGGVTPLEMADLADEHRQRSVRLNEAFDRSDATRVDETAAMSQQIAAGFDAPWAQVKQGAQAVMDGDMRGAADVLSGGWDLAKVAGGAVADNKTAAFKLAVENVPQLLMGGAGAAGRAALLASNAGYASDYYQKGLAEYQAKHGGAMPPEEERLRLAGLAASLAVAEELGEGTQLALATGAKGVKAAAKAARGATAEAAEAAADEVRTGFLRSMRDSIGNTAKATAGGVAGEAITEGYQTFAEGEIMGKPAKAGEIFEAGVLGGAVGGALSGSGRALGEITKSTPEHATKRAGAKAKAEAFAQAAATGNVDSMLDPAQVRNYNPSRAIEALSAFAAKPDTSEEARTEAMAKASSVVAGLAERLDLAERSLRDAGDPAQIQEQERLLAEAQASGNTEAAEDATFMLEMLREGAGKLPELQAQAKTARELLGQAQEQLARFTGQRQAGTEGAATEAQSLQADLDLLASEAPQGDAPALATRQAAAGRVLNLSMVSPDAVDAKTATSLANDKTNGLSTAQRDFLKSHAESAALLQSLKNMDGVNREVLYGGNGNLGLADYRSMLGAAMRSGNAQEATRVIQQMTSFMAGHRAKALAFTKMLKSQGAEHAVRLASGEWTTVPAKQASTEGELDRKAFMSPALVGRVREEAKTGLKLLATMQAAYQAKFITTSGQTQKGAQPDVSHVPQAHARTEAPAAPAPQPSAAASQAEGADKSDGRGERGQAAARKEPAKPAAVAAAPAPVSPPAQSSTESEAEVKGSADVSAETQQKVEETEKSSVEAEGSTQSNDYTSEDSPQSGAPSGKESSEKTSKEESGDAVLAPLNERAGEDSAYTAKKFGDLYKQSAGQKGEGGSLRPLATVKNLLTQKLRAISEFVQGGELSDTDKSILRAVFTRVTNRGRDTSNHWGAILDRNLKKKGAGFEYQDLMTHFIQTDEQGNLFLEENVKTALVAATMGLVHGLEAGRSTDPLSEVRRMLRRDDDEEVTEAELAALAGKGSYRGDLAQQAGKAVMDMLGLKPRDGAPLDAGPRLAIALGGHAVRLAMDTGLVKPFSVTRYELDQLAKDIPVELGAPLPEGLSEEEAKDAREKLVFLSLPRGADLRLDPDSRAAEIVALLKEDPFALSKILGAQAPFTEPSLSEVPFKQKGIMNSLRQVPAMLAKALRLENSRGNTLRPEMWALYSAMGEQAILEIAGFVDPETLHVDRRAGQQAKNDGLARELGMFADFVTKRWTGAFDGAPIFLPHRAWNQQRVGVDLTVGNPQSSKIVRRMLTRPDWETTIDPNNREQLEAFLIAVAEGLGVKVDRNAREKALGDVLGKMDAPVFQDAVQALRAGMDGATMSPADTALVLKAVKEAGEGMASLDALVALAGMSLDKPFKTHITMEVDGVANGPILSLMLMGTPAMGLTLQGLANRGGIFEKGSKHRDYNTWRAAAGNQDLYETLASRLMTRLGDLRENGVWRTSKTGRLYQAVTPDEASAELDHIGTLMGSLVDKDEKINSVGRNFVKTPLTAPMFGASLFTSRRNTGDKFIEAIYKTLERIAANDPKAPSYAAVVRAIDALLEAGNATPVAANLGVDELMERPFTKYEVEALKEAFNRTMGQAVMDTMGENLGEYLNRRNLLTSSAKVAFTVYAQARKAVRAKFMNELMDKGELAFRTLASGEREPIHDLTSPQAARLDELLSVLEPKVRTPLSKLGSSAMDSGLTVAKTERQNSAEYAYSQELGFSRKSTDGSASMRLHGESIGLSDPGVGMMPKMVHALDSFISHMALQLNDVLNVHDAHATGLKNLLPVAQALNRYTTQALVTYNPLAEMADALSRTLEGLQALVDNGDVDATVLEAIRTNLAKVGQDRNFFGSSNPLEMLQHLREEAQAAEIAKSELLANTQAVSQYAAEGGHHAVTAGDVREAQANLEKARQGEHPRKAVEARLVADLAEHFPLPNETAVKLAVLGGLGDPAVKSSPQLVALFKDGPVQATDMVGHLRKMLSGSGKRVPQYQVALLGRLEALLGGVTVRMVYPATLRETLLAPPTSRSFGWYVSAQGKREIYVLSPEFAASGLTPEVLLHEMVHGALADLIDAELQAKKADPDYTSEALELVEDLEALRVAALARATELGLAGKFSAALGDVQEFVAWGIANPEFQRSVLVGLALPDLRQGNSLVRGMKAFVQRLVGLLFVGSDKKGAARHENGLALLISRVAGLMGAAAQGQAPARQQAEVNLSMATAAQVPGNFDALQLHDALSGHGLSAGFDAQLRELLRDITSRLGGPFGAFRDAALRRAPASLSDVWLHSLSDPNTALAKELLTAPFSVSEREGHAMEQVAAVVKHLGEYGGTATLPAYRELQHLFSEMRDTLTPADLGGQAQYDFLFGGDLSTGDHLARFAAFGLANEQVVTALKRPTKAAAPKAADSLGERLQQWFMKVLAYFTEKISGTYQGQPADSKLNALMDSLVATEARRQAGLLRTGVLALGLGGMDRTGMAVVGAVKRGVGRVAASNLVRNSGVPLVRLAGRVGTAYVNDRVEELMDRVVEMRNAHSNERYGLLMGVFSDVRGHGQLINALSRAFTVQQRDRKNAISSVQRETRDAFSKELDWSGQEGQAKKAAITQVLLRSGAHHLLGTHTLQDIQAMLEDPARLAAAIASTQAELNGVAGLRRGIVEHYINQANALGYFTVTGVSPVEVLMRNAHNIARLYGTNHSARVSTAQAEAAQPIITRLIALRSLDYSSQEDRTRVAEIMAHEAARTDGNGAQFTLGVAKRLEKESLERLFSGNEALMLHGYTAEIYDPNVTVEVAEVADRAAMEARGFTMLHKVGQDPAEPWARPKALYAVRDGGLARYASGVLSTTAMKARGTATKRRHKNRINLGKSGDLLTSAPVDYSAARHKGVYLVPVMNALGGVSGWNHVMSAESKDTALRRNSSFDEVLGAVAGSIMDKSTAPEMNRKAVEALKEQYDAQRSHRPNAYVRIGPGVTDPARAEHWALLPKQTRDDIIDIWGEAGMLVPREAEEAIFGYRQFSVREMFDKEPRLRGMMERLFVDSMEGLLGPQAALKLVRGERIVEEVVREAKDIIVVRSGMVALGNFVSNLSLLWLQGVPPADILRGHLEALRGLRAYNADLQKLQRLEMRKTAGMAGANVDREIALLQASMERNPVHEMVDLGLLPTIVEDVAEDANPYAYKTLLADKVDSLTSSVPKAVKSAAKVLYMGRETSLYQGLRQATEVSDFMARYVVFKHLTQRAENPLSAEDAAFQASELFINYDTPMPRALQYMDNMGITMFTKYFLRIQRVLVRTMKEKPARVLSMLLVDHFMSLGPIVLDSSWIHKFGNNPLNWSAGEYLGALDELATAQAGMALLK